MSYDPGQPSPYGYQQQQHQPRGSGLAITALVIGIVALLLSWTVLGGVILGLAAMIVGFVASSRAKRGVAGGRGMAITGIVLGVLSLLIGIGVLLLAIFGTRLFLNSDTGRTLQQCLEEANGDQARIERCQRDLEDQLPS